MKIKELRQKTSKELESLFLSTKKDLSDLRRKSVTGELKNVRAIRAGRKLIAQIQTLQKAAK